MPSQLKILVKDSWETSKVSSRNYLIFAYSVITSKLKLPKIRKTSLLNKGFQSKILVLLVDVLAILNYPRVLLKIFKKTQKEFSSNQIRESSRIKSSVLKDPAILILGSIDWHFRFQRGQQMAKAFAKKGYKTIYLNPTLINKKGEESGFCEKIDDVEIWTLPGINPRKYIVLDQLTESETSDLAKRIETLAHHKSISKFLIIAETPAWTSLLKYFPTDYQIYDCIDSHRDFLEKNRVVVDSESDIVKIVNKVFASSEKLVNEIEIISNQKAEYLPNAVDFDYFRDVAIERNAIDRNPKRMKIGYYGAVAEWFDLELVIELAQLKDDVDFEIIGAVTNQENSNLKIPKNVKFLGEIPYVDLIQYIKYWNAAMIPFKISPFIESTNPFKIYEYLAAEITVVSTKIPEVVRFSEELDLPIKIYTENSDFLEFISNLEVYDFSNSRTWIESQTWEKRIDTIIENYIEAPSISIIVLMWNKAVLTIKCLTSIVNNSNYDNYEIILVDNASEKNQILLIEEWIERNDINNIRIIKNEHNYGFSGGNNVGLRSAKSDYIVILNNDTEVTFGWLERSIKHFRMDSSLGLLGFSTDNIGNEGRIKIPDNYFSWESFYAEKIRPLPLLSFDNRMVAFFGVMIARSTYELIGELDEIFGVGGFEDDDYCERVIRNNKTIKIARDIFVHHELSSTFKLLGKEFITKNSLKNKALFEQKWGTWKGHKYAEDDFQ